MPARDDAIDRIAGAAIALGEQDSWEAVRTGAEPASAIRVAQTPRALPNDEVVLVS